MKDRIKHIESLLPCALHADRHACAIELKRFRRAPAGKAPGKSAQERLARIEARLSRSARIKQARLAGLPEVTYNPDLPITQKRDEIVRLIREHPVVIVSGETGSGKTTQLPKFCLEAGRGIEGRIACTQPRRIAAITVAARIAEEIGTTPGESVGYKIRFKDRVGENTVIKMMTDGILLAETQGDKYLNEYDTIIVDEAHERSLNIDFLLGLLKQLVSRRRDLKLIITSATIDTEKFSKAFSDAPIVEVSGRMYPVDVRYMPPETFGGEGDEFSYVDAAVSAVDGVVHRESPFGDILIFMPTEADIRETCETLEGRRYKGAVVLPLYARLPAADQSRVFKPAAGRKIIVATNVAETSITIPGIKYVIDTGLARISNYIPGSRTTALPVAPVSKSSADQRKGRCGRVANGVCIRLYSEDDYQGRPMYTPPEILRANLAEVILRMIALDLGEIENFPFVDPPPPRQVKDGFNILRELGAIDTLPGKRGPDGAKIRLTRTGEMMAKLPLDPRLSKMLIEARENGVLPMVSVIAAALTVSDPRERPEGKETQADQAHAAFVDHSSDFITLYNIWRGLAGDPGETRPTIRAGQLKQYVKANSLSFRRMREWIDVHDQISVQLEESGIAGKGAMPPPPPAQGKTGFSSLYAAIHKSVLSGFLANIAEKKEKNIFRAARQREVMIFPGSALFNRAGQWIVAAEIVETSRRFARMAAAIDVSWLEPLAGNQCKYAYTNPRWQRNRETVIADEQVSLYGLIIVSRRPVAYGRIDPAGASGIFIREALVGGDVRNTLPFMEHNRNLVEEIRDMENRVRRRDLLVSEIDIQRFYEARLSGIWDMRTLRRRIREEGSDDFLKMTPDDLMAGLPDDEALALFPDCLPLGGTEYACTYRFNPGGADDGVTVTLPVTAAGNVPRESTDWVVPGLLSEKITGLIRNLPKVYRKRLVPVNDTVAVIMREMPKYRGALVGTLSRFVHERFGVDVPVSAWSDGDLPEHLKLRFSLVDPDGKEVASGRDRGVLNGPGEGGIDFERLRRERKKWEKTDLVRWEIGDLPEVVSIPCGNGRTWPVYPGLEDAGGTVNLRLYTDRRKAETGHRAGMARLFAIYFAKELKHLKRAVVFPKESHAAVFRFGGIAAIEAAIADRAVENLFARNIRTEADFNKHARNTVNRIIPEALAVMKQVAPVLAVFHETRTRIDRLEGDRGSSGPARAFFDELRRSLDRLVPVDFIATYDPDRMPHLVRYLAALSRRAERGINDLEKDLARTLQVEPFAHRLVDLNACLENGVSAEKRAAVAEYQWMIEEFRVSLFAQELKTPYPVSEKRLEEKYEEIQRMV